jgi:hypothetical protein
MVTQVDEHKLSVIALAVDPSGQADRLADIGLGELCACVRAKGVHSLTPAGQINRKQPAGFHGRNCHGYGWPAKTRAVCKDCPYSATGFTPQQASTT